MGQPRQRLGKTRATSETGGFHMISYVNHPISLTPVGRTPPPYYTRGFYTPLGPLPFICEGEVHCFQTLPWQRFYAVPAAFSTMALFCIVNGQFLPGFHKV